MCSIRRFSLKAFLFFTLAMFVGCISTYREPVGQPTNPESILVASIFSMSGEARDDNAGAVAGVKFAVEQVNEHGGVLGRPLKLIMLDNESTTTGSRRAATEAAGRKAVAIIGASWSSHSLEVAGVAQRHHIPMITNVSTHKDVTRVGNYIFRVCFTDPYQGKVMAKFALREFNASTAVVLVQKHGDYSIGLADSFSENFRKGGGSIVARLEYNLEEKDFSGLLEQVRALRPDVLFIPGHHESARIIRQAQTLGIQAKALGGDGWGTPGFYESGGTDIREAYFSTHWSKEDASPASRRFVQAFGDSNLTIAPAALAADAVGILVRAIESSRSTEPGPLRDALARTRGYEGVTGNISLDENRDPIDKSAVVMVVRNGEERFYQRIDR